MKSDFFHTDRCQEVAVGIKDHLNAQPEFLSNQTSQSTRAVGDAIQQLVAEIFGDLLGDWCKEYSNTFARRAMADLAFAGKDGSYCVVDVKTHREDTAFNMPNLTSVERLSRFYEDDSNIFSLLVVKYRLEENRVRVSEVIFSPLEFLCWDCLTIGALGWGQIQIANSNNIIVNHGYSRKQWMLSLCDALLDFYPKEIAKTHQRIDRFTDVRSYWNSKEDIWI